MSDIETVNFGLLGAGVVADFHQQAIRANSEIGAELTAVAHYNRDRFDWISDEFGVPCMSEQELLKNDDVDVVTLCTPSGQHPEQAVRAARAGKHVLVEKPMALRLSDAETMYKVAEKEGVQLGVVFNRRVEPLFRRVHRAIQAGDLGELTLGSVVMPYYRGQDYFDSGEWRGTWQLDGGGVLMNQGIHLIDLLVWYMGDPVEIEGTGETLHRDIEVEDTVAATLKFANGARATITATTTAEPGFPHRLELYGTNGGIQIEGESVYEWKLADPNLETVEPPNTAKADSAGSAGDPEAIELTGHVGIVRDFVRALQEDRSPLIDGKEGQRSLRTILEIYESAGLPLPEPTL